jgi:hypothetical protein
VSHSPVADDIIGVESEYCRIRILSDSNPGSDSPVADDIVGVEVEGGEGDYLPAER